MNHDDLRNKIVNALKNVYDPEIPVNIYDLGLIYDVKIDDNKNVEIIMTLTSPNCPVIESLPMEIKFAVDVLPEVKSAKVTITFEPPWDKNMMSESAKLELNLL